MNKSNLKTALICMVNHMDFGGCQKIVFNLLEGTSKSFSSLYLIASKGYYSNLLSKYSNIIMLDREQMSFYSIFSNIKNIEKKYDKVILHTHNRVDILFRYFLNDNSTHLHTFHSAYLNKNFLYKFIKPEYAVSISQTVSKYLIDNGISNHVIYNGINLGNVEYQPVFYSLEKKTVNIVYVGRLTREKGFDNLIESILSMDLKQAIFNNICLTVIGDGDKLSYYKEKFKKSSNINVSVDFKGFLSNPWELINSQDILIIPSYFEGFCLVAAEGASLGIPVLGNDILALREVLDFLPDNNFFNIHSIDSVQQKILLCFNNLAENQRLASDNKARISERFSQNKMIANYLSLYESFL